MFWFVSLNFVFCASLVWIDVVFWQEISCWHDGGGVLALTLSGRFHKRWDPFICSLFLWLNFSVFSIFFFNSGFWCHDAACFLRGRRRCHWWRRGRRVCAPRPQVLPPRLLFFAIVVVCLLLACPSLWAWGHRGGPVFHLREGVQTPELPGEAPLGAPPRLGCHQTPQAHQAPASAAPRGRRHPHSHVVAVTSHFPLVFLCLLILFLFCFFLFCFVLFFVLLVVFFHPVSFLFFFHLFGKL